MIVSKQKPLEFVNTAKAIFDEKQLERIKR